MIFLLLYLFGIIVGLYLNDIALFLFGVLIILLMVVYKNNKILILLVILAFVLGFARIKIENSKYYLLEKNEEYSNSGIVVNIEKSTKYKNVYWVKQKNINLKLYTPKNICLEYGDIVYYEGEFFEPERARNEYGFDNRNYLKQKKIGGYIFANKVEIKGKDKFYNLLSVRKIIKNYLENNFSNQAYGFINGIFLADSSDIDSDIKDNFKKSSLLHILAISGMHINIIVNILNRIFEKLRIHKKKSKIIICILLILYMILIGNPVSCMRAVIMELFDCISFIFNKNPNFKNNIIASLIIICFLNPYNVLNIGLWLSYGGTIGIVYISKFINKKINHIFKPQNKFTRFVSNNISVSISVQLLIFPIIIYSFNIISLTGIVSNLIISPFIEPLVYLIIISICLNTPFVINCSISLLYKVIELVAELDFLNIYIAKPHFITLIIYYSTLFYIILKLKNNFIINYRFFYKKLKIFLILIIVIALIYNCILIIPNQYLEFDFIDVGQGDCSLIITPKHKTILIDGGNNIDYDNGQKTILPILINKHIKQIDYLIISHFDSDHVGGLYTILEEYKVKQVIISKQAQYSDNFKLFMQIINNKQIQTTIVDKGTKIDVENNIYIDFLWPDEKNMIDENCLNNNSIVCKLNFGKTSILFTGDIEKEAEQQLIQQVSKNLESTILKVAHHGSNSSTISDFVKAVSPKIAVIGVGENNKFGHPNDEIISRLENSGAKIFRTDQMGEIIIKIDNNGIMKIKYLINKKNITNDNP